MYIVTKNHLETKFIKPRTYHDPSKRTGLHKWNSYNI